MFEERKLKPLETSESGKTRADDRPSIRKQISKDSLGHFLPDAPHFKMQPPNCPTSDRRATTLSAHACCR